MPIETGTITISTGVIGTQQNITFGFKPKAIIVHGIGRTATGVNRADAIQSFGVCDGSLNQYVNAYFAEDNVDGHRTSRFSSDSDVLVALDQSSTLGKAKVNAILDNGFQLEITEQFSTAYEFHYWAISGVQAEALEIEIPASTGTFDTTSLSINPDTLILSTINHTVFDSQQQEALLGIGVAAADGQGVYALWDEHNVDAVNIDYYANGDECIASIAATGGMDWRAALDSFLTGGFRLDVLDAPSSTRKVAVLAIRAGESHVTDFDLSNSTGNQDVTDWDQEPKSAMLLGWGQDERAAGSVARPNNGELSSMIAFIDTDLDVRLAGATNTDGATLGSAIYIYSREDGDAIEHRDGGGTTNPVALATLSAYLSNGIRLNFSDAAPTDSWMIALMIRPSLASNPMVWWND